MKINPVNAFILDKVAEYGETVVVLGARRAESSTRAQVIAKHRIDGTRLGRHTSLPKCLCLHAHRRLDRGRGLGVPHVCAAPLGRRQPGAPRALSRVQRRRVPHRHRHQHAVLRQLPVRLLDVHSGHDRQGDGEPRRPGRVLDAAPCSTSAISSPKRPGRSASSEFRNHRRRTGKVSFARGGIQDDGEGNRVRKHVPGPYWMRYRREVARAPAGPAARPRLPPGRDVELIS